MKECVQLVIVKHTVDNSNGSSVLHYTDKLLVLHN